MTKSRAKSRFLFQPLDRVALILMAVLCVAIAALLLKGDRIAPRVRSFSWQDRQVGAEDIAFLLTFSRPMNHSSVETNLRISPELPGKISWAGRRMAYTLETPAPYGSEFQVELTGAIDRFSEPEDPQAQIRPFSESFSTRDRAFVYLGVEGDQAGRLVLQNLTQGTETVLTPANLVVMDFEPYPDGDRILFSASDRDSYQEGSVDPKIYTVTTGIHFNSPRSLLPGDTDPERRNEEPQPASVVTEALDNQDYQNLKFDLAPDGSSIVIQRVNRDDPGDFGLWVLQSGEDPYTLDTEPAGDFLIAPDSQSVAVLQGEGTAILTLGDDPNLADDGESDTTQDPEADSSADTNETDPNSEPNELAENEASASGPLDFLPQFGRILSFAKDGSAAALVKFNPDFTQSLFVVTNQGEEREVLQTVEGGSVMTAQFDGTGDVLYCLITRATRVAAPENQPAVIPGEMFIEEPFLLGINSDPEDGEAVAVELLKLPVQRDIQMSLAPDNLGLLFDQVTVADPSLQSPNSLRGIDGQAIAESQLWFLPLILDDNGLPTPIEPQPLGLPGLRPRWIP